MGVTSLVCLGMGTAEKTMPNYFIMFIFFLFSQHHAHVLPRNGDYCEAAADGGLKGGRCQGKQDCDSGCCKGHSGASSLKHEETGLYWSGFHGIKY